MNDVISLLFNYKQGRCSFIISGVDATSVVAEEQKDRSTKPNLTFKNAFRIFY